MASAPPSPLRSPSLSDAPDGVAASRLSLRLSLLDDWARQRSIWVHDDVRFQSMVLGQDDEGGQDAEQGGDADAGFGVYVKPTRELDERQVREWSEPAVVLTPKSAILSLRTSSISTFLPPTILFEASSTSGLLLTLVLTHEWLKGAEGEWWGYLQSLPRGLSFPPGCFPSDAADGRGGSNKLGVPIPLLWPEGCEASTWIQGTEASRIVSRAKKDPQGRIEGFGMSRARIRTYFSRVALPALGRAHPDLFDDAEEGKARSDVGDELLELFERSYSIISSRAFVVDMFHGLALVPLADMFNHSDDQNAHFEADDEVCDECGALGSCPHSDDPLPSTAYGRPSSFMPASWGPNSVDWPTPPGLEGVDTVDMVAEEQIEGGQEAFNSYGLLSNAQLFTGYAFAIDEGTRWERVGWEWRDVEERAECARALGLGEDEAEKEDDEEQAPRGAKRSAKDDEEGQQPEAANKRRRTDEEAREASPPSPPQQAAPTRTSTSTQATTTTSLRHRWATLCAAFIGQTASAEDLLPFLLHPELPRLPGSDTGGPTLTLPLPSPLRRLALPSLTTSSAADEESEEDKARALSSLSTHLSPLSTHDGTHDLRQPLFLDAEGRPSLVLWRAALLGAIAGRSEERGGVRELIADVERSLDQALRRQEESEAEQGREASRAQDEEASRATAARERLSPAELDDENLALARGALQALDSLISQRISSLRISREGEEERALRLIENRKPPDPLVRFAAVHAFLELATLRTAGGRIAGMLQALEAMRMGPASGGQTETGAG